MGFVVLLLSLVVVEGFCCCFCKFTFDKYMLFSWYGILFQ